MAYNKSDWECAACKKDLKKRSVQCYLGKKYCHGACTLEAFVIDENMELYIVIEKNPYKRETMRAMIDEKYRARAREVEAESFDWVKDLMGWG